MSRKTYTYSPYEESQEVIDAGTKKTNAEDAYNTHATNGYTKSQNVIGAETKKTDAENAYNTFYNNGFTYSNDKAYQDVMSEILSGKKFTYDLNGDALYQQYKDKYIQQGKMAMADTMGQAAAMTGGYGNSYAASVGNQAYQASLQQLNDIIPELYQMAYDRYSQDRQDLYNKYGMLSNDKTTEYGMWTDKGNRLATDRSYYSTEADNAYNRDYGQWVDKGNMLNADRTYWGTEYNNAYTRDYNEHTTEEAYKYQNIADANTWALSTQKSPAVVSDPTLSASEYNDVLTNAGAYAKDGKTALANYLNGLVGRGLSKDEAAAIYEQYFPTVPELTYDYSKFRRGGLVDTIN